MSFSGRLRGNWVRAITFLLKTTGNCEYPFASEAERIGPYPYKLSPIARQDSQLFIFSTVWFTGCQFPSSAVVIFSTHASFLGLHWKRTLDIRIIGLVFHLDALHTEWT